MGVLFAIGWIIYSAPSKRDHAKNKVRVKIENNKESDLQFFMITEEEQEIVV
jgi:hypothetical protein